MNSVVTINTREAGVAQLVEHFVANEDVRGSSPLTRSNHSYE